MATTRLPPISSSPAILALLFTLCFSSTASQTQPVGASGTNVTAAGWTLLWRDEFGGQSGAVNRRKWSFELGEGCQYLSELHKMCGFGNGELQYYTSHPSNARVEEGHLVIEARKEENGLLTSARLKTLGHFSVKPDTNFKTIRVEAKILLPQGKGLWPAFWMLPSFDNTCLGCGNYGRWAASGEIDIMESSDDMQQLHGTLHFGGSWPDNKYLTTVISPPDGTPFGGNFHTYAIEWEKDEIRWYVDDTHYSTQVSSKGTQSEGTWFSLVENAGTNSPFDKPFHILLNLALGGGFPGNPSYEEVAPTLQEPKRMLVDYVRVFGWQ